MQNGPDPERPAHDIPPVPKAPPSAPPDPPRARAFSVPSAPGAAAPSPYSVPLLLELRVTKRILWIGTAVYPLATIARVYTFVLRPKRKEAVLKFLRYTAGTLVVGFIAMLGATLTSLGTESDHGALVKLVWVAAAISEIIFVVDMLGVLTAASQPVLAVETSGASTALVTSRNWADLDRIVDQLSYAIEHPDAEFRVTVQRLTVTPHNNYYFGDNVNMYGGSGNVGISA